MPRGSPGQPSDQELVSASPSLLELPAELLIMILEYLPLRDLTKTCLVIMFAVMAMSLYVCAHECRYVVN